MSKKLIVTLEITVEDLSDEERLGYAKDMDMHVRDLPGLTDCSANQAASVLSGGGWGGAVSDMFFEGTDHFVKFTESSVQEAHFEGDAPVLDMVTKLISSAKEDMQLAKLKTMFLPSLIDLTMRGDLSPKEVAAANEVFIERWGRSDESTSGWEIFSQAQKDQIKRLMGDG